MKNKNILTTSYGIPVSEDNASITTSKKEGYTMLQDIHLVEKLAHFNRERIPERVVHAKGAGAGGYFEVTNDLSKYTRADFLSEVGKKTEVFVRFSTVGGERGSADAERDPRGFAVKFYTEEGNYDIVGNNTPVFFIRDAIKFPDFVHTQKRNPQTNLPDPNMFWDFLSLTPESIHQISILFSDRGTPQDYRHMDGHSSHTYMWYNNNGEYVWVKYHFKTRQGWKTFTSQEAEEVKGKDTNHATKDLFDSIEKGNFPIWDLYVQIMSPEQAKEYKFDPFDVTKVWYHSDFPLIPVGTMTLNRNPENYFAEVEQAAFAPSALVPGIGVSPDKLLQGRIFAYEDAHRYRLGANHHQIEVNSPKNSKANTNQRDGAMNIDGNGGSLPNYYPNTVNGAPKPDISFAPPQIEVQAILDRHARPSEDVDFIQAGELYSRVLSEEQKSNLINNISNHLGNARENLQYRQTALFYKANEEYGTKIAEKLGLDVKRVKELANMSQNERVNETL